MYVTRVVAIFLSLLMAPAVYTLTWLLLTITEAVFISESGDVQFMVPWAFRNESMFLVFSHLCLNGSPSQMFKTLEVITFIYLLNNALSYGKYICKL